MSLNTIEKIELDESSIVKRSAVINAERANAIRDLLKENSFNIITHDTSGPYHIKISVTNHQLVLHIKNAEKEALPPFQFSLSPYRSLIKDYFIICESYQKAFGNTQQLETIDMARRALHNEGAETLLKRLACEIKIDFETARCLFTLICVLHIGGGNRW